MHQKISTQCLLLAVCLGFFPLLGSAAEYRYDQEKSSVRFTIRHFGLITVEGRFKTFAGSFGFDLQDIEGSHVNITIQSGSVESGSVMRDQHLQSENFFAAKNHPQILFVSKKFTTAGENRYKIDGDLTIRGITQPTVFTAELLTPPGKISQTERISFHAQAQIRRKDFHLGTNRWVNPVLFVTDETLTISLNIEGIPAVPVS